MKCGYCQRQVNHNRRTCPIKKRDAEMFEVHRFPQKFSVGSLVVGHPAPPRWAGERPRTDWTAGVLFHILSEPQPDYHSWGGMYDVICLSGKDAGKRAQVFGDFLNSI